MRSTSFNAGLVALVLLGHTTTIGAHSWVQQMRLIGSTGTFVGDPGYPRGFVPRTAPGWNDFAAQNKVPIDGRPTGSQILPTDLMCASFQQIGNQTAGFPTLTAAPGDSIALLYAENGHVTKNTSTWPNTRPAGNGTVFIYGTTKPMNTDTYLGIHRVWNAEGSGGDGRGKLLATRSFDDGQCYQISGASAISVARQAEFNNQTEQLCQNDVQIPTDAGTSGPYTLYWVWEYPTMLIETGKLATNESYTTCMDVTLSATSKTLKQGNFKADQPVGSAAIKKQLDTPIMVNPTAPLVILGAPPVPVDASSPPAAGNGSAATPAPTSAAPAPATPAQSAAPAPPAAAPSSPAAAPNPQAPAVPAPVTVTVTQTIHDGAPAATANTPATASPPASKPTASTLSTLTKSSAAAPASTANNNGAGAPKPSPFLPSNGTAAAGTHARRIRRDVRGL